MRYDGGHRFDEAINTCLSDLFAFKPFCPEVAIGLGVPREPIQLVRTDSGIAVRGLMQPDLDVTLPLSVYGEQVADDYSDLCGYIFKARSPSCGLQRVVTVDETGALPLTNGRGAFAASLTRMRPDMPVIEEGALLDHTLRENFIEQVCAYFRRQQQVE